MAAALADWPAFADEAGVTAVSRADIAGAHDDAAASFFATPRT